MFRSSDDVIFITVDISWKNVKVVALLQADLLVAIVT